MSGHGIYIDSEALQHLWSQGSRGILFFDDALRQSLKKRVVLVTSRATVAERLVALHTYRDSGDCWTLRTHSDDELPQLAKRIVGQCRTIAQFGTAEGFKLAWIDPLNFEHSIASEAERLTRNAKNQSGPITV